MQVQEAAKRASSSLAEQVGSFSFNLKNWRRARREGEIMRLTNLLDTISQQYFKHLIDLQTEQLIKTSPTPPTDEDKKRWKKRTQVNFLRSLNRDMLKRMPAGYAPKNATDDTAAAQALHAYFCKNLKPFLNFATFENMITIIFTRSEKKFHENVWPLGKEIPRFIAWAIQDIVIDAINTIYKYNDLNVSEEEEKALIEILKDIEFIRTNYTLPASYEHEPDPSMRDITTAVRELKLEIAQVNEVIWLPLRSFVTAPLSKEDFRFYVKNSADAENLARQMVRNDGVILITGYRGVGKSTFINYALDKLAEVEQEQGEGVVCHVIPIQMSLAKATNVSSVLRLCVRSLYHTLIAKPAGQIESMQSNTADSTILLKEDERQHIRWANLRATYKVNLQQGESVTTLKQLQAAIDMKLADLIPQNIGGMTLGPLLPTFGFHSSKEWSKKVDRTVALFDYDEDQAETDLVTLIEMLARPRIDARGKRAKIKLSFIFDEMDKMDEKEGQLPLIQQLKNLFLTRNAVFLLVTSKEFYYLCLNDQKREDAVLSSYFSSVVMMPLFTAKETEQLLKQLIWMPSDQLAAQDAFVQSLARYLTYRAKGVPREIIRQLQEMQKWVSHSLQPYITDGQHQKFNIQVYAQIQQALERLVDSEETVVAAPPTSATSTISANGQVTLAPERIWMNQERKDQIRHGLYVLVEELLDRTCLELVELGADGKAPEIAAAPDDPDGPVVINNHKSSPDRKVLENIFESNFRTVLPFRFNELVVELAQSLLSIQIEKDTIFSQEKSEQEDQAPKLTVSKAFYQLTGRSSHTVQSQKDELTLEEIYERLSGESILGRRLALNALGALQKQGLLAKLPAKEQGLLDNISTHLFRIFMMPREEFRTESAKYLSGNAFFVNAERERQLLLQFIKQETDEQLLRECIRLIDEGATDDERRRFGTEILLELLESHRKEQVTTISASLSAGSGLSSSSSGSTTSTVPGSIIVEVISKICTFVESTNEDVLGRVVQCLDPGQDIPKDLLAPLKKIAAKSRQSLIELLVAYDFRAISSSTLRDIFSMQNDRNLKDLWLHSIEQREKKLAREVVITILQQLPRVETLGDVVLQWLDRSPDSVFSVVDQPILREAARRNPHLPDVLEKMASQPEYIHIHERLEQAFPTVASSQITDPFAAQIKAIKASDSAPAAAKLARRNRAESWLVGLTFLAVLIVYFAVPYDLPVNVSLIGRLMTRFLEAVYVYGIVIGLFCIVDAQWLWTIIALVIAIACFLVQIFFFPLAFTIVGQLILLSLLVLIPCVLFVITVIVGAIVES